jgi:TPR repeat protein
MGDAACMSELAEWHRTGACGLAKNEEEALRLYRLSAEQGDPQGQVNLGVCYEYGRCGLAKNEEEALRLYRLSAEQGDPRGKAGLRFHNSRNSGG